jgi:LysR family glycine cleavage system transcriptional activator
VPFADGLAIVPASERADSPAANAFIAWMIDELEGG